MKSHELASLADVTVRALRHYHQVGVLPEPERGSNGYRDYTVLDLVRLLRIKRLAALGIPLEKMPAMLDGEPHGQDELLDRLEHDLEVEIERLRAQQSLIRVIRANEAAPDFPPELARFFALFGGESTTASGRVDREQAILLAHLVGDAGTRQLAAMYESIAQNISRADILTFVRGFDALSETADDAEIDELVDRFARSLAPVFAQLAGTAGTELPNEQQAVALLGEHQRSSLNSGQNRAAERLIARLS